MTNVYQLLSIFPREILSRRVDNGIDPFAYPPEEWRDRFGEPAQGMYLLHAEIPADEPTEVYAFFNATHLGIGVINRDYDKAHFKPGKPGFTWDADAHVGVDIYLDPGSTRAGLAILSMNAAGGRVQKAFAPGTPCYPYRWRNRSIVTPQYWAALCWIEFEDLGMPAGAGDVWGLNILRRDGGPNRDYFGGVSLAPNFDFFKFPEQLCRLRFGNEPSLREAAIAHPAPGLAEVRLRFDPTTVPRELTVELCPCVGTSIRQSVMPAPEVVCILEHGIADRVLCELRVTATGDDGEPLDLGRYRFHTPAVVEMTLDKPGHRYGPQDETLTATVTPRHPRAAINSIDILRSEGAAEIPVATLAVAPDAPTKLPLAGLPVGAYLLRGRSDDGSLRIECAFNITAAQPPALRTRGKFLLTTQTDFPDDLCANFWDWPHFGMYFDFYRSLGVERIYWMEYGTPKDTWMYLNEHGRRTFANVGDYLGAALIAARRSGLEFFATIKPYETGIGGKLTTARAAADAAAAQGVFVLPDRVGGAEISPCEELHRYPDAFFKRRNWKPPYLGPIAEIRLYHVDEHPVDVTPDDFTLWVSNDNVHFEKYQGNIETSQGVRSWHGAPRRYIAFAGLALTHQYLAFTCAKGGGTFVNRVRDFAEALDPQGNPVDISVAMFANSSEGATAAPGPLRFNELGWGVIAGMSVDETFLMLDYPDKDFAIGIGRGSDRYLLVPDASEPQGVEYLLSRVRRAIAAGVDGIKFRLQHHHTYVEPRLYGYSRAVIEAYAHRYGVDITATLPDPEKFEDIHGDFYTEFYRRARELADRAGIALELQVPETQGFMCELPVRLQWERWIALGLADAIELKNVYPGTVLAETLRVLTRRHGIPLYCNPYFGHGDPAPGKQSYTKFLERVRAAGCDGFLYYESWSGYRRAWVGRNETTEMVQRMPEEVADALREVAGVMGEGK